MHAANEVIGGHGVEALECEHGPHGPRMEPHAVYINMGDTYITTLIREHTGRYIVSSWGDYVERHASSGHGVRCKL